MKELSNLNPNFISFSFSSIPYHIGAEKFYIENSYITYSKRNLCYLYSGTGKCNASKVDENRFVQNHGDPINNTYNYTVLDPENKWNNIVNDWNYDENGKRFKKSFEYINPSSKPRLVSKISQESESNTVFKNFVEQMKYSSDQLFPNL